MKKNILYAIVLVMFTLVSCKNNDEYKVDSVFNEYIERFRTEAALRGRVFDFQKDGLIVEFGNLSDNVAGLCHYETPIRIEVDKTYWDAISKTAGSDVMKENLIFHEMGHGFLGRKHLNTTLPNGDWKSIMCGGDKVDNRSWNINYRGIRRKYYLDELFKEETDVPSFASMTMPIDTTGYTVKISRNFNSEAQSGWPAGETSAYKSYLTGGRFCFETKTDTCFLVRANTDISVASDFSLELTMESNQTKQEDQYGIFFGSFNSGIAIGKDSIDYFTINNAQKMFMGNRSWYSFFTELTRPEIKIAQPNKLKIFKSGKMLYYFINNVYTYCSEVEAIKGKVFGFQTAPQSILYIDNFKISQKSSTSTASRVKSAQQIEFSIVASKKCPAIILSK